MSACNYSEKYLPLVQKWIEDGTFLLNVPQFFIESAEEIAKIIGMDREGSIPVLSMEVKEVSFNKGLEVNKEANNVAQYYLGEHSQYMRMTTRFKRAMVETAIYNPANGGFLIDANTYNGDITYLNQGIINYKKSLLHKLVNELNIEGINIENASYEELTDYQNTLLAEYRARLSNNTSGEAYDAFVILSNFDQLLGTFAPYISIAYPNAHSYNPSRYHYNGPSVKHYTGVMSKDEFASAEDNASDISKILLDYFQEVDENGHDVEGASINIKGFNSAMTKVYNWAKQIKDENNTPLLTGNTKIDSENMYKILDIYINKLGNNGLDYQHITYLKNKLRGIQKYIYGGKIDPNLTLMLTHQLEKTMPSNYIEYNITKTGSTNLKYLTERPVLLQRNFLWECLETVSEYWLKDQNKNTFNNLLKTYNISIKQKDEHTFIISFNGVEVKIVTGKEGFVEILSDTKINNFDQIIEDIAQLYVNPDTEHIGKQIYSNASLEKLYMPIVASIIMQATKTDINYKPKDTAMRDLGRILSVMYGSDVLNVVKNGAGNSLPLYQMLCLAYRHDDIHKRISQSDNTIYTDNLIYKNIGNVLNPQIRSGVINTNGVFKSAAELTTDEVLHVAILYDFYKNLTVEYNLQENIQKQSGIIGMQSHVYSDKNKHFVQMFDLSKVWNLYTEGVGVNQKTINIIPAELLRNYINGDNDSITPLVTAIWKSNKGQLDKLVKRILFDYKKVFGENFKSLNDVRKKIAEFKDNIDDLRAKFVENGIEFKEEIHASKVGGNWTINGSLVYLLNQFSTLENTNKFIATQFERFNKDIEGVRKTIVKELETSNDSVDLDRMLYAYFITDILFTNNYNQMMVGHVFAHPHKNEHSIDKLKTELRNTKYKGKTISEEKLNSEASAIFETESFASRWIGQVKRMVIYGATYHSYAQGLEDGVPEYIKTAVIEDLPAAVYSITGQHSDKLDSMDGSGFTHPIFSRLQNRSLLDAAVFANKKTIYHDIDGKYGTPTLLKWAEYEITNEKRRNSHNVSLEKIYKKMSSLKIDKDIKFEKEFDNLYYRDKNGDHYRIDYLLIENGVGRIIRTKVDENGIEIGNNNLDLDYNPEYSREVSTIYDIDQLLGGAWAETLTDEKLEYTETNLDILTEIVCKNQLKDYMIGWLVNKSGMKVGWSNLNTKSSWTDDTPLRYTTLSTRFGGLQMNADHELDYAEVTEMTQVISALEQMGVMHDVVSKIYEEIGKVCYESIKDIIQASETDINKLYQIYGKAIVESFNSDTKDTLGLAQSFCALAQKSLQDNKITYRIPFSSSSINGIFNSTVTSQLIKKAIRRHYSGVAAVLNPSYNMIEYYNVGGLQYRKEELLDVIKDKLYIIRQRDPKQADALSTLSIDDFINGVIFEINGEKYVNPFIEDIDTTNIDFEDTIILIDENGNGTSPIKIDNLEKYHLVKNDIRRKKIHTLRPKNLKGSNTTFVINNQVHSVYESPYTLALHYFINNSSSGSSTIESFKDELKMYFNQKYGGLFGDVTEHASFIADNILNLIEEFQSKGLNAFEHIDLFRRFLLKKQQNLLNNLSEGKAFDWYGNQYISHDVKVYGAQIGMGRKYAKEFGLRKGDSLAKIKKEGPQFFYKRIGETFTNNWRTNTNYDHVLYDGKGEKIYVKVLASQSKEEFDEKCTIYKSKLSLRSNTDYVVIDGTIYHGTEELCSKDGKEVWVYEDESGNKFNLFIVDSYERLQELENTQEYIHREDNYTEENYQQLLELTNAKRNNPINPTQWNSVEELLDKLNTWENDAINKRKLKWAEQKYANFLKSLEFVGARIPCQNMTSFAPMEVVMFSDVEVNEIYLPPMITWLEGADYDIDKTYLLGFSVSSTGTIHLEGNSKKYASDILKNNVVTDMLKVIKNPKTQINLTTPLSVDNMQNLAAQSVLGEAARRMNPYNPACKYMMQIENMVGKNVIGNVATAIKSFFALSHVYNQAFNDIYNELVNGDFATVKSLLDKYSFKVDGKYRTLANVNMTLFDNINWNTIPIDVKIPLLEIYNWQAGLDDQSLILAELLNAATDNAKELILKKINADTNWVDIYTSAFILGENLNTVGNFMISPEITELISNYSSSIFDKDASFETKIQFIEKSINNATTSNQVALYTELLERVKIAEELRILGKILKINQGMPTNTADFYEYVSKIEYFIESKLNSKNISQAFSFSKSQKQFTETSNLFIDFLDIVQKILNYDITEKSIEKNKNKINSFIKAAKLHPDNLKNLRDYYQKSKGHLNKNDSGYQKLPKQIQDVLNTNVDENGKLDFKNCTDFVNSLNAIYEIMTLPGKNIDGGHKQIFEKLESDFWGFIQKCFDSESSYFSWVSTTEKSNREISNELWEKLQQSWKKFDLIYFVRNEEYAKSMISEYESVKEKFNILDTLKSLPHFNKMYEVLALNDRVLTVLSKRNRIESEVWRNAIHKNNKGRASALMTVPNVSERKILKSLVDDTLINTWLTTSLTDVYLEAGDTRIDFDGSLNVQKLKSFIENSIISRLRRNMFKVNGKTIDTRSSEFVRRLSPGKNKGESIFKLSFNMSEIDSNPGIKQEYEKVLKAFGELKNIRLEGGLTVVDVFYLYNLIVHKDHFGRNSLTRLFEDLISAEGGEQLLVFKFNEWLETVNEEEIIGNVLSSWGAAHSNDNMITKTNNIAIHVSTTPLNKTVPFYSGGAPGSDSAWGMYLRQQGFAVKDFTVNDWDNLSSEQKAYYEQLYQTTVTLMQESGWPEDTYAGKLTRRDMMQADSATSIFAIGTLSRTGKVNGGTRYATYAAISQGKPVYLFNLNNNSWYWYDYNSSSFIKMNDKPNLISGAAVIGTRDDKSIKSGATGLRASGHEAIKDIIDRSLKLSSPTPKSKTVKYTPKGQSEQTYTIIGNKIFNSKGEEVYTDENNGHRQLIFVELALQENRAVKVEYRNLTYVVNERNQIFSTSSNKIVYQNENDGNRRIILEKAKEEFAKLFNQSSPKVEIYQGYWTRTEVESQTDKVFLFGDNTDDRINTHYVPTRTQAVIRGLSNAIGIDTKKNRGTSENSYFTDVDFDIFKAQVDEVIQRAIDSGKIIVIPSDGIGTGKAELDKRAPKLFAYLQQKLDELKSLNSTSLIQFDDSIDISEESVAEEPVTIGFGNTSDRISEEPNESNYIEPIRRLQLLDDYYRPIFTSGELISFEEDAKRIFDNESILNERINIHYSEWKTLDDITYMRRWEKIWEDMVYDGNAEESENDFKYNNKSKTVQIPKYIYDRIKLYQKYQKLVDFLMGIAQKNNYYDYYGNLLRHDEDWFGDLGGTSLDILKDLYDLSGIKEIYDDPNQLKLFDSLHIDSDYIADATTVYQTIPSKQSKLIEIVRQANEKGIKGLHAVYQSDLINEDIYIRSANGFVRNGEIYINVDRAGDDTVIHEFGHLYLADAKIHNREKYYALLDKVRQTALWANMKSWKAYANKIGSDFDEEVLATMIGDYYKSEFVTDYEYTNLVKEALSLVDGGFIDLINSEILPDLGDTFITNYALSQKTATLKSKLVSDNILKENCL